MVTLNIWGNVEKLDLSYAANKNINNTATLLYSTMPFKLKY